MTPQPPSLEDLLRERLHEVDEITPPDTDFAARALRAGRARANRRRSWTRGLVGVAAAAAIGAFVVPSVMRSSVNSGGSAASSAGAAATAGAPEQAPGQAPNPVASGGQGQEGAQGHVGNGLEGGSRAPDPGGPQVRGFVASLRSQLAKAYPDTFTALVLDEQSTPHRAVLHMTVDTPAAQRMVRDTLPATVEVDLVVAPYSSSACTVTFQTLSVDTEWAGRGAQLAPKNCDVDGRVALSVLGRSASAVLGEVRAKYGDRVVAAVSGQG